MNINPADATPDILLERILPEDRSPSPRDDDDENKDFLLHHDEANENSIAHVQNNWEKHALIPSGKTGKIVFDGRKSPRL